MDDHQAMLAIQKLIDGTEWNSDTMSRVAEIVQQAGYQVRDLDEVNSAEAS